MAGTVCINIISKKCLRSEIRGSLDLKASAQNLKTSERNVDSWLALTKEHRSSADATCVAMDSGLMLASRLKNYEISTSNSFVVGADSSIIIMVSISAVLCECVSNINLSRDITAETLSPVYL